MGCHEFKLVRAIDLFCIKSVIRIACTERVSILSLLKRCVMIDWLVEEPGSLEHGSCLPASIKSDLVNIISRAHSPKGCRCVSENASEEGTIGK
jgi:hypothetical protein